MKKRSAERNSQFSYIGTLSEHPLPELLFTIAQYKVPGVITFINRGTTKQIFIRNGNIIFAASNAPDDHLGDFLFHCGKVSRKDYDKSIELMSRSKGKWQGEILVELGAITKDELPWAVRSHQQAIVRSLFNWFEGSVQFNLGTFRHTKPILLDIPIPRAILDGVRQITQAKKIMPYLGTRTTVLEQEENALLVIELFEADDKERDILKRVDGQTGLYDLCANAPYPAHETAKILYGLLTLKLVRKKPEGIHVVTALSGVDFF